MRIVRYKQGSGPRLGLLDGQRIMLAAERSAAYELLGTELTPEGVPIPARAVHLIPPFRPTKIVAVGLNYRDHAEEQGEPLPAAPLLFARFPSAVTGPYDDIEKPKETAQLDYEAELGVVIGRAARRVSAAGAMDHVAGYVVVNDVSARDAQFADGQWVRGKSFDTFAPMGPALVSTDEVDDPHALDVRASER